SVEADRKILSTFGARNKGLEISLAENNAIEMKIYDGEIREGDIAKGQTFTSDSNTITPGRLHHIVFIVDGASNIVSVLVDGVLSDGSAETRPYGWGRLYPYMKELNDTYTLRIDPSFSGEI